MATVEHYKFEGGANMLTSLSPTDLNKIMTDPSSYYVGMHGGSQTGLEPVKRKWDIFDTSLQAVNDELKVLQKIEEIHQKNNREKIVILDWGGGNGRAAMELHHELERQGVLHHIYVLSHDYSPNWQKASEGITFILDDAANLHKYLNKGSVNIIFSHIGLSHFLTGTDFRVQGGDRRLHLNYLKRMLKPEGVLRMNGYFGNYYPSLVSGKQAILLAGKIFRVISKREDYYSFEFQRDPAMGTESSDIKDFMNNYSGSIYYPSGGLDLSSLFDLVRKFPKVSNFIYVDTLNVTQNLGLGISSWPKDLSSQASQIQRILLNNFDVFFERIHVKVTNEEKKELLITLTFYNDSMFSPDVRGRTVTIRYVIGDLFDFNEKFDVIYVKLPGFGGWLSGALHFWNKIDRQLGERGYLLVSNQSTDKPNNNAFIQKGHVSNPNGSGVDVYHKNVDRATLSNGGIDFTSNKTPLEIKNSMGGIKFHIDSAMLTEFKNAPGLMPVIIDVELNVNLKEFLGIN
jgi:hypothetical protein